MRAARFRAEPLSGGCGGPGARWSPNRRRRTRAPAATAASACVTGFREDMAHAGRRARGAACRRMRRFASGGAHGRLTAQTFPRPGVLFLSEVVRSIARPSVAGSVGANARGRSRRDRRAETATNCYICVFVQRHGDAGAPARRFDGGAPAGAARRSPPSVPPVRRGRSVLRRAETPLRALARHFRTLPCASKATSSSTSRMF